MLKINFENTVEFQYFFWKFEIYIRVIKPNFDNVIKKIIIKFSDRAEIMFNHPNYMLKNQLNSTYFYKKFQFNF